MTNEPCDPDQEKEYVPDVRHCQMAEAIKRIKELEAEVDRLKEYEYMYKNLCK